MPTDNIQPLDTEQVNRVLVLALNTKKLKQNALDTTSLLNEVNIDYARTMNKIIFDVNLRDPTQPVCFIHAPFDQHTSMSSPLIRSVPLCVVVPRSEFACVNAYATATTGQTVLSSVIDHSG
jgi:hypothetical protein